VRIAVAATPAVAIPTLRALRESAHNLAFVITMPDAPAGRGRAMQSSAVAEWAVANEIDLFKPDTSAALGELITDVDLVITIGYGSIIPINILKIPKYGFINLHFSLLPRWRGAAPVQRAIEAGDKVTGVTVFQLDAGMDTGPIYQSMQIPLEPDATAAELFEVLALLGIEPVLKTVALIEAGEEPIAQTEIGATRAHKLSKEEGQIDWSAAADEIKCKVNAFNPSPGAWSLFRGQILKINRVALSKERVSAGKLLLLNRSIYVGSKTDALEILEVTPAGKSAIPASAWANGARITATDELL